MVRKTTPDPPTCIVKVDGQKKLTGVVAGSTVTVSLTGNANSTVSQKVRAYYQKADGSMQTQLGECWSIDGNACNTSHTWQPPGEGLWYVHCDVPDVATKCSGYHRCGNIVDDAAVVANDLCTGNPFCQEFTALPDPDAAEKLA